MANKYGVRALPTIITLVQGDIVQQVVGALDKNKLISIIDESIKKVK